MDGRFSWRQVVNCLGYDIRSFVATLEIFDKSDAQRQLQLCLSNPSFNSDNCLLSIQRFIFDQQGPATGSTLLSIFTNDIVFGASRRPCQCYAQATQSLVGQQLIPLVFPPEEHQLHCDFFGGLVSVAIGSGYLVGLIERPAPPEITSPSSTNGAPYPQAVMAAQTLEAQSLDDGSQEWKGLRETWKQLLSNHLVKDPPR